MSIHPAVKQHLGKAPLGVISDSDTGHDLAATPPTATDVRALPGIREEKGATRTNRKEQQDISVLQKPKSVSWSQSSGLLGTTGVELPPPTVTLKL